MTTKKKATKKLKTKKITVQGIVFDESQKGIFDTFGTTTDEMAETCKAIIDVAKKDGVNTWTEALAAYLKSKDAKKLKSPNDYFIMGCIFLKTVDASRMAKNPLAGLIEMLAA